MDYQQQQEQTLWNSNSYMDRTVNMDLLFGIKQTKRGLTVLYQKIWSSNNRKNIQ